TSEVRHGPFVVSIKSSGEIRAANSFTLTTPRVRWGQMQIVFLVPEGNTVKQGDVVVRFATTEVDKNIADKESELNILKSDLAKFHADKALRDAELEGALRNAELAFDQGKLQVEKMKFEAEVQRKEAEINLEKSRLAFEQAKRKISSQAMVDKSEERKLALKIQQTQRDIDGAKRDKEEYTLKAARGGLVVYEMNWSTNRKINVGDNPWPGMPVVSLPDLSRMQSISSINEVDISKVKKDQHVSIRLDAFPEREFTGTVAVVGTIGQQRDRQSAIKTFEVVIDIEGTDPILKPGMTTSNEIVQQTLADTTFVPIESVFERDGKSIVYRMSGSRPKPVEVAVGTKNSNYVIVSGGDLKGGERVTLRDPNASQAPGAQASKSTEKPS
ncbi:MAG TPA: efflux RND transporter periplasmic adaptor subunit, partial [Bacteroidota bacterium]